MNTFISFQRACTKLFWSLAFLAPSFSGISQSYKGRDGAKNYITSGSYILNRYTTLASSVSSGAVSFTVADISQLSGAYTFTNSTNPYAVNQLRAGDLVMIIQMQGADINTADNSSYGAVTAYNGAGNYELRQVYDISGNTIHVCQSLSNAYTQSGRSRTQIVRVPRLSSLTVGASAIVTGTNWAGATGGVVALEVNNNLVVNGSITGSTIGFRGGVDDKAVSSTSGAAVITLYRSTSSTQSGSKGEGIAGNPTDYNTSLNGNYGRGAPANGGGGGNGHNSGGGGGSNAGNNGALTPWNGTGIKSTATAGWASAWNLESAGFATDVSVGGGRGGYSYSNSNQDALVLAPGATAWGGDYRQNVGGFGARPLNYNGNTRLFMGGGGGAGEGNNLSSGDGGNGGGIVYLLVNGNASGSGTITSNGQDGYNTQNVFIDAAGGAGGGGAIVANVSGSITGISMEANGGKGGDQLPLLGEAEGPGGGGGGGYIATTSTSVTRQVLGGANGISGSAMVTEFTPNGATIGAAGTVASTSFSDVSACDIYGFILPIKLLSFNAIPQDTKVALTWVTESEENSSHFEIEKSFDGHTFSQVATVFSAGNSSARVSYAYNDVFSPNASIVYYKLKMIDKDKKYSYSNVRIIRIAGETASNRLITYPNPAISDLRVTLPSSWQDKKVRFEVYDINGKLAKTFDKNNAVQTETISIQEMSTGLYVLRATMGNETAQQRIVKK